MKAAIKFVFVTLVAAILLLSPLGACAGTIRGTVVPGHECCPPKPASLPDDCARPLCVYMDTQVVPTAVTLVDQAAPFDGLPASAVLLENRPATATTFTSDKAPLVLYHRFVVFHQILV